MGTVQATLSLNRQSFNASTSRAASIPVSSSPQVSHVNTQTSVQMLDGRCTAADRCPRGQGFYHRAVLADGLGGSVAAPAVGTLRLTLVPRDDSHNGTEFSLVTVVSEA